MVTFVGSVRLPNVKKDPLFFSYATLNKYEDYLFHDEMKQMLEKLTDLSSFGITMPCFITIWRYRYYFASGSKSLPLSAGYGHYCTGAPSLYTCACALKRGVT